MAGVTNRGQVLLVGAFVVAVTLVGLTLVLTADDFTATIVSEEDEMTSGAHAVTVRESVERDLESLLVYHNQGDVADHTDREDPISETTKHLGNGTLGYHAEQGRLVNVTVGHEPDPFEDGTRIKQTSTGPFASDSDPDPLAHDTTIRNVTFVATDLSADPFIFRLTDGSDTWELRLVEAGAEWVVRVVPPTGPSVECRRPIPAPGEERVVDVDNASFDGEHCPALDQLEPSMASYDVEFENGDRIEGRYWLTARGDETAIGHSYGSDDADKVIYSVDVLFRYHSPSVEYETELRIAPGELT